MRATAQDANQAATHMAGRSPCLTIPALFYRIQDIGFRFFGAGPTMCSSSTMCEHSKGLPWGGVPWSRGLAWLGLCPRPCLATQPDCRRLAL